MGVTGVGSGSQSAAAAAAAERQEEIAREQAEAAKRRAEAAQKAAQQAQEQARKAQAAASAAQHELQDAKSALSEHPDKKTELEPKLQAAQESAAKTASDAQAAQQNAVKLTTQANDFANRALAAEKAANTAAGTAGEKVPFAAANQVKDVYDAKALSAADQNNLFGSALAVSSDDAARVDAQRLGQAQDPGARAKLLASYLQDNQDPSYQTAFLAAAKPEIQQMSKQVWDDNSGFSTDQRQGALDTLTRMSEQLPSAAQKELATEFAQTLANRGLGSDSNNLGGMLQKSIEDGSGATFGVQLASALQAGGKTDAANDAANYVGKGISDVKQQFDEQSKEMDQKNALLAPANQYKDATTPQETARLAQDVKKKIGYADAKKNFEAASAKLVSVLHGADLAARTPAFNVCLAQGDNSKENSLAQVGRSAMGEIPSLAKSDAGTRAIAGAVEAEGEGKETFLDHVKEYGEQGKDFLENVRGAVITAVGARALSLAEDRNFDKGSRQLFQGLNKLGGLFGASDAQMSRLTMTMSAFRSGLSTAKTQAIAKTLDDQIGEIANDPKGGVAQSLKGLGTVLGVASAYEGIQDFGGADLNSKVQTITGALGTTKESAELLLGATTKYLSGFSGIASAAEAGEGALSTLGKTLDPALQLVGAVTTGIEAYDEFKDGQVVAGVGDSVTAAGSLIAGLTEAIPGVDLGGEAVGDTLAIIGQGIKLVGSFFSSPPDPFGGTKDGLKQGFMQSGFNEQTAGWLSELHGKDNATFASYFEQVAKATGQQPSQLLNDMKGWSSDHVAQFLDAARLSFDTDSNNFNRYNNAQQVIGQNLATRLEESDKGYVQHAGPDGEPVYNAQVIEGAANWLYQNGLIPSAPLRPGAN